MIVRREDGSLLLVPQTEHSLFVGQLAAHWGNDRFATPEPFESVARAAAYHDFGYLDWEPDVPFDTQAGVPYEFRKLPTGERQLAAYQHCIDWMTRIDPYSGLLVSMHRTGLWKQRYGTIAQPPAHAPRPLDASIHAFIARNEATQDGQKQRSNPAGVAVNYHLLQVWDLLGLYFGCQEPGDERIDPVPTGYGKEAAGVALSMKNLGGRRIRFDPYPFRERGTRVQMRGRRLEHPSYRDEASFRRAYYSAPWELLEYELV